MTLACRSVRFGYAGAPPLLRDVSFELRAGERCLLIGRNGSGKSTLCRLLAGLYVPDAGAVVLEGAGRVQLVTHDPAAQVLGATVLEDVALGGLAEEAARQSLRRLGVEHLSARPTDLLSGGELQLVRLAGALAARPPALVLDEALAQLDAARRRRALAAVREAGVTVLLATHTLEDLAWAERVIWLEDGTVHLDAPSAAALEVLAAEGGDAFELPAVLRVVARLGLPATVESLCLAEALCASTS